MTHRVSDERLAYLAESFDAAAYGRFHAYSIPNTEWHHTVLDLRDARAALEQERVRLAGCGVAAMQNTTATIVERAKPGDYGYSASYGDVCQAVDREMDCRAALAKLEAECAALREALESAREWANRISGDERVCGWVHGEDYGLYCLLADCPVDFEAVLSGTSGAALLKVAQTAAEWRDAGTITEALGVKARALIAAVDEWRGGKG